MTPSDTAGRRPEPGPEGHDDDPTGIRALLAALPDPGPMPQDLVERIGARLAVEQAHREQDAPGALAARSDSAIDLAAERSHRRPGRTVAILGAAAAGLLVATVGIGELAGVGPGAGPSFDSAAQVPARSAAGADSGAGDGSDTGGGEAAPGEEETLLDELPGAVVVLPELGTVGADDYRDQVLEQATRQGASAVDPGGLTAAAAGACWQGADPSQEWPVVHAAQALMDGRRVVVLLGTRSTGTDVGEAMVMPWSCTAGETVRPLDTERWSAP